MVIGNVLLGLFVCNYGRAFGLISELIHLDLVLANNREAVDVHMEKGKEFLAKGQFTDALHHFHEAVELDPNDYQIYFRRATVLLATGKVKAALPDLDKVVELKPDFTAVSPQILFIGTVFSLSRAEFNVPTFF